MTRWQAVVFYRSNHGEIDVTHDIEELEELGAIVESGPSFAAIDRIEIRYVLPIPKETADESIT